MNLEQIISRLRMAIAWRLNWLWWRGIRWLPRRRTVCARRLGLELKLDLRDDAQYFVYREGAYEPNLRERICRELHPGDIFVDVGAHVGIHSLIAARQLQQLGGGGHVFAFEPATDTGTHLAEAAARNGIGNLTLVPAALGSATGHLELRAGGPFGADDPAMRSAWGPGRIVVSVPVLRFDDWVLKTDLKRLDLIKLDVEGGELEALIGMRKALASLSPRKLFIETNPITLARAGLEEDDLYKELERSGYKPLERIRDHGTVVNVVFSRAS